MPIEPRPRPRPRRATLEAEREDALAVEEPLEIRVRGEEGRPRDPPSSRRCGRPGNDEELAAGLLFAEGVLRDAIGPRRARPPVRSANRSGADRQRARRDALARRPATRAAGLQRGTVMGSACGVCGKTSIENVHPVGPAAARRARCASRRSFSTRCRRACGSASRSSRGRAGSTPPASSRPTASSCEVREDIGRHNATDKLVGSALLARTSFRSRTAILLVSGRAGFEIVQKAFAAGIPLVASVSAPSSLAVGLAETGRASRSSASSATAVQRLRATRPSVIARS